MKFKHTPPHLLLCALFHLPALPPGNKAALYGLPYRLARRERSPMVHKNAHVFFESGTPSSAGT